MIRTSITVVLVLALAFASGILVGCSRVTGYEVTSTGGGGNAPGVGISLSTTAPIAGPAPDPANTPDDQRHIRRPTVATDDQVRLYTTITAHSYRRTDGTQTRPVVVHCEAALLKIPGRAPIRPDAAGGGCYGAERMESGTAASATAVERVVIEFSMPPLDDLRGDDGRVSLLVMVPAEELLPTRYGRELGQPVLLRAGGVVDEQLDGPLPRFAASIQSFLRGLYAAR